MANGVVQRMSTAVVGLALLFAGFGVVAVALAYLLGGLLRSLLSVPARARAALARAISPATRGARSASAA